MPRPPLHVHHNEALKAERDSVVERLKWKFAILRLSCFVIVSGSEGVTQAQFDTFLEKNWLVLTLHAANSPFLQQRQDGRLALHL